MTTSMTALITSRLAYPRTSNLCGTGSRSEATLGPTQSFSLGGRLVGPRKRSTRAACIALIVVGTTVAGIASASAHVTVHPDTAPKGGFEILSFSVPNEKDDANTVKRCRPTATVTSSAGFRQP
jgi:hypothetical protein